VWEKYDYDLTDNIFSYMVDRTYYYNNRFEELYNYDVEKVIVRMTFKR
jgi:hypothetical protein